MTSLKTRFKFHPAVEEFDSEYVLISDEAISVQVCAYGGRTTYGVNEIGYEDSNDKDTLWVKDHGMFRTLKAAQQKAVEVAASRHPPRQCLNPTA